MDWDVEDWYVELTELEALFDSQCGEDTGTQNELGENFDVSALHLDDVLARSDAYSALGSFSSPAPHVAPQQGRVQAPQPAAQYTKEAYMVERKRAQNREAQARYRQKAKVRSSRLV